MRVSYAIIVLFFIIFGIVVVAPVKSDANSPSISVGDHWTYNYSVLSAGLNLTGTLKMTVVSSETISSHGMSIDVFKLSEEGSGFMTGATVTGSWTISGTEFHRRSDLATAGSGAVTITIVANGVSVTVVVSGDLSIPQEQLSFPLAMGKTWTQTVTTNTNVTTTVNIPSNPPHITTTSKSNTTTTTYAVIDNPVVSVEAGTFDTYEIRSSDKSSISLSYYSPQANYLVKSVGTNSTTGQVTASMTLKEYGTWAYKTSYNLSGNSGTLNVQSDVSSSNFHQNATALSFTVSGRDGTSGHLTMTIPSQLNTTDLAVYMDNQAAGTITRTSDTYTITFGQIHYSSHTFTITYAKPANGQAPSLPFSGSSLILIIGAIAAVLLVVIVVAVVATRRRGRNVPAGTPSQQPPPPSAPGYRPPAPEPQPMTSP